MGFLRKLYHSSNFWPLVIVILFAILAGKGLIGSGYFNMHDDLQMMRQLEMEKCFLTLQIPCRWVPDMGYGFGFPLFNFYPPLPYLYGEIFRVFGFAFTETVKLTFISAFIFSGISMYYLAKEFWGKLGGIVSSIFYVWAPYHAVDIYVRGAMDEAWAWIWIPSILASSYHLITKKENKIRNIIWLAISWFGILLSHNLTAMIFAPVFIGWCAIWLIKNNYKKIFGTNSIRTVLNFIAAGILSLGLAAFFTLPVLLEQKYVQTNTLIEGYYDFSAHFATIKQLLFSRFWGYGPSVWGANDGLTFQVGYLYWILPIIILGIGFLWFIRKRKIQDWMLIVGYFFVVGWVAVFMIHNKSTPIWEHINTLRFVQFPWRFLTIVVFSFSFAIGSLAKILPNKFYFLIFAAVAGLLIMNWNYFVPEFGHLGPLTDAQKFTGAAWDLQRTAGIYDYLPVTAVTAPKAPMTNFVEVLGGDAKASNINLGTNNNSFDINVTDNAIIRLGVFEFPGWKVFVDGKEIPTFVPKTEQWGRMYVMIPVGAHHVQVHLYDTPIRTIGNIISLISWIGLGAFLMLQFNRGRYSSRRAF
ncbi:MAG TPA: hypothetical protein VG895_03295 [Patescibacteria group bacterium]|nr:hypothetical protein [Patescibacteria group bacterium]